MAWEIEYFELESGRQPAEDFEDAIPRGLRAKLLRFAEQVAESEGKLGGGYWEPCHGHAGVFAVRVIHNNELGRYYAAVDGNRMVLLHGYRKRPGQATPAAIYGVADRHLGDYRNNHRVSPERPDEEEQHEQI
jgi:hypothetical protein